MRRRRQMVPANQFATRYTELRSFAVKILQTVESLISTLQFAYRVRP